MNNKRQRNKLFTMLMLVMAWLFPQRGWAETSQPSVGNGSKSNPYEISTAAELAWFRDYVNGGKLPVSAKLTADIDLKDFCYAAANNAKELSWEPIGNYSKRYTGTFDGNGHTISNLYIKVQRQGVGFFGCAEGGSIKNITFDNAQVENTGNDYNYTMTGIVVGAAFATLQNLKTLKNCSVKSGAKVLGGIAGSITRSCSNLENNATVSGKYEVGGIAGRFSSDYTMSSCVNNGMVAANRSGKCGGIVGFLSSGTIEDCANYGNVTGTNEIGGIVGYAQDNSTIKSTLSCGNITSQESRAGIIVGYARSINARNMLAYSNNAKLTINGTIQEGDNIKTVGEGNLGIASGSTLEEIIKGFTQEQLKSGEVAWLLNGSTSVPTEGSTLAWYQKLGENGDAYPVLKSTGDNTVYGGYQHGSKDGCFSNTVIANQHSVAYNAEAVDEANGNHDLSYEAGEYTWTEAEDKTQVPSVAVTYTCKVCGKTEKPQMTVEHDAEHDNVEATCTEDGHKYYKTSYAFNDKAVFSDTYTQTLPALGHNMSEDVTFNDSKSIYQKGCTRADCDYHDYYATSDGSIEAKPNDDASAFTVEAFTLNDATVYNSKAKFTVKELNYTRSFAHDKWQALYVPFETEVTEELLKDFELAAPNNLHEYELADGSTKISLEAKLMKSGYTIKAQRPYLIRAKEAGEKTIQLTDCPLKAAAEDSYVDCSSVLRHYKFIGTLKGKTSFDTRADFVLQQGLFLGTETDTQLKPMRWYLNATDRDTDMGILPDSGNNGDGGGADGGNGSTQASRCINITIVDGDATTGIDELHVITEQTSGSKNGARPGIYDLHGRKLSQEPQNGVYIKDGKKVVK